ncbi:DNA polymerase III subunit gamma/tau [Thermobrachium celere]|uniref:DNA-directed DNA polymerase n=1 Tax=Thermobrachium celere DSM 8682 TaxID=941824 RepID=R7RUH0_9CLOT|nr:DNA polymerase III subunit gamma/tau [Thermobrachium celere]GFR35542.1 DNA polymerase III subunit gamma/tau [Thermobrachium celere]CDF59151.1 DNA polymerase III subunits gamma and tau [Thermobrachium celere DSM 8682]
MYKALYREFRPQNFSQLVGQENIVRTLKNQILQNKIPHAYLFCGTRGTGKTSTAKILSKAVNCLNPKDAEPCNECEICREINAGTLIDVFEIDAASNNRVENVRELIEDVKYPPHRAKYKVYIIDEVHMLSQSAFNALLKTLEEPPRHVIFILATTDPQKVPPTILSRCQRFDFKRITTRDMVLRLREVVNQVGALCDDDTLELISRVSDGAMRDALSILDQAIAMSDGKVEYQRVSEMLGLTSNEHIFKLVDFMIERNIEGAIRTIDEVILSGKDVSQFIKDMTRHFRNLLLAKVSKNPEEILDLSKDTINMLVEQSRKLRSEEIMRAVNLFVEAENSTKITNQWRILLEMTVIRYCKREYDISVETIMARLNTLEEKIKEGAFIVSNVEAKPQPIKPKVVQPKKVEEVSVKKEEELGELPALDVTINEVRASWHDILNLLKANKKMIVYAYLEPGDVIETKGNKVVIGFDKRYSFSKDNLDKAENKKIAEEYFSKVLKKDVKLEFRVLGDPMDDEIDRLKNTFGEDLVEVIE